MYTGRDYDAVTGLQYNRARFYDPAAQRWLTEDPLGLAGGDTNLYRYVYNSGPNFIDPSGKIPVLAAALVGAGVGAGVGFLAGAVGSLFSDGPVTVGSVLGGGVNGAIAGAFVGGTMGALGPAAFTVSGVFTTTLASTLGGGLGGYAGNVTQQSLDTGRVDWDQAETAAAAGFIGGAIAGPLAPLLGGAANRIFGVAASQSLACSLSTGVIARNVAANALAGGGTGMAIDASMQVLAPDGHGFSVKRMLMAGLSGAVAGGTGYMAARSLARTCFVAGTPLRVPGGSRNIEDIRVGELVLARDEHNCEGTVEAKLVEEVFVLEGLLAKLRANGRDILTTMEHPFFVAGHGWVPCNELKVGDRLWTESGAWVLVEEVEDTGIWSSVYNLRVADFHTYFVGCDEWGFSVWAHNSYDVVRNHLEELGVSPGQARQVAARMMDVYLQHGIEGVRSQLAENGFGVSKLTGKGKGVAANRLAIERQLTSLEGEFRLYDAPTESFEAGGRVFTPSRDAIQQYGGERLPGVQGRREHDPGTAEVVRLIESQFPGLVEEVGLQVRGRNGQPVTDLDVVTRVGIIQLATGGGHVGEPIRTATAAIRGTHLEGRPVISVTQAGVESVLLRRPLPQGESRFVTNSPLELIQYLRSQGANFSG